MTLLKAVALIEWRLNAWRREEIDAIAAHDETRARDARLRAGVLEQLRNDLMLDAHAGRIG